MVDQTLQCIRESMIYLLNEKEYSKIRMKEIAECAHVGRKTLYRYFDSKEAIVTYIAKSLMDHFVDEIKAQDEMTLQSITYAFFLFVKKQEKEFKLLKKARLLSYIEDHFFELITDVAAKTKFSGKTEEEIKEMQKNYTSEEKYALHYTFSGYYKMAILWITEDPEISPRDIAALAVKIQTWNFS